jgi:hypothetical protein
MHSIIPGILAKNDKMIMPFDLMGGPVSPAAMHGLSSVGWILGWTLRAAMDVRAVFQGSTA